MDDMIVDEGGGSSGFSGGGGLGGPSSGDVSSFSSMVDEPSTITVTAPGMQSGTQPWNETVTTAPGGLDTDSWVLSPSNQDPVINLYPPGSTGNLLPSETIIMSPGGLPTDQWQFAPSGQSFSTPSNAGTITYGTGGSGQGASSASGHVSLVETKLYAPSPSPSGASSSWVPTVTSKPPEIALPPGDPGDDGSPAADPGAEPGGGGVGGGGGFGGGGGVGSVSASSPEDEPLSSQAVMAAITEYYQQILGRVPDAGGLVNYTNAVLSGSMTLAQVQKSLADSPEAQTDLDGIISGVQGRQATAGDQPWIQAQQASLVSGNSTLASIRQGLASFSGEAGVVTSMYQGLVGRDPSATEISATEAQLANGVSLQTIRTADASSPEAVAQLKQIYQNNLGRQADAGGLANYEGFLANGGTLAQVAQSVGQSQEAQGDLDQIISDVQGRQATAGDQPWIQAQQAALANGSTTLDAVRQNLASFAGEAGVVTSMYQGLVGRAPSAAEISATEAQLAAGVSLQTIRTADASSPEAVAQLKQIYQNDFGRQADAPGLAGWEGDLASGRTLAQVRQQIAQSLEAQNDLKAVISDVQGRQATAADQPWIQAQQAALASGSTTLAAVRQNLASFSGEAGVVTSMYQDEVGRDPSAAEISATEAQLADGVSLQTIRTADASSPESTADIEEAYAFGQHRDADPSELALDETALANGASIDQITAQMTAGSTVPGPAPAATFRTLGISQNEATNYLKSADGTKLLQQLMTADPSADDMTILARATSLLQSGTTLPQFSETTQPVYKVVPSGATMHAKSPYFTSLDQLQAASLSPNGIANILGLPASSTAATYQIYEIVPNGPQSVLLSTIAPTEEEGVGVKSGGGTQSLVLNRDNWSTPVLIGQISNQSEFTQGQNT